MLAVNNYAYTHHQHEPTFSRLSFSFSKYERKRKSSSKQLNKSFAKSSSSAYYRRKFDIKKNKSSNKESNQRNDRFILADILDDLQTECKGDVYDLVPCSINSVLYKHNIRPRLCLLCKTVTSADLSNIHNVQCSQCLTHLKLTTVAHALNGDVRSLRVCAACVLHYSLCTGLSANCVYMRCCICKQNENEQLSSSSFALNTIECGGCKTYMKHRFNRSAFERRPRHQYVCSSCAVQHNLCYRQEQIRPVRCQYGICRVCTESSGWRRRYCEGCNYFYCVKPVESCGRDGLCKTCLQRREDLPVIAWLEQQMRDSYCEDIKQVVLRYLSLTILKCQCCDRVVEVRSFTELSFGTTIDGEPLTYYLLDEQYKKNVAYNDLFARNQRSAVVVVVNTRRNSTGQGGKALICSAGNRRYHGFSAACIKKTFSGHWAQFVSDSDTSKRWSRASCAPLFASSSASSFSPIGVIPICSRCDGIFIVMTL